MENKQKEPKGLGISTKSFLTAIGIIFALMVLSYVLTFLVPGGSYSRTEDGVLLMESFQNTEGGMPFWKWILSPVLVLTAEGSGTILAVIAFLIVMGGVFNSLNKSGMMLYMLKVLTARFGAKRYRFLAIIIFFFMAMGSLIGSFEECVPLVPIVVSLCVGLGFDALTGLAASLLAVGCGFAAGVFNPFTVGVAQKLADLPMFSGVWLRALSFVLIYVLLTAFILLHAKKIRTPVLQYNEKQEKTEKNKPFARGLICFGSIMAFGIIVILSSALPLPTSETVQSLSMIIVALSFLVGGIVSVSVAKMGGKFLGKTFLEGVISMLPAVLMILMASSIKYILQEANILDTLLHGAIGYAEKMPKTLIILFIYLIVLVMNFFIASGSAKAVMLMPLIVPLAGAFQIPAQLCVVAYAFGDGFSNVLYPTNPVLLISLGLTDIGYGKWFKWSGKFQLANLVLTAGLLLLGLAVGYC